jgi:hypothetical protein
MLRLLVSAVSRLSATIPRVASCRTTTAPRSTSGLGRTDAVWSRAADGRVRWWCGWQGMQGVRGSNPLSSTTTNPDGRERSRVFARKGDAEQFLTDTEARLLAGTWIDPRRSRRRFGSWADEWWQGWAARPRRSPGDPVGGREPPSPAHPPVLRRRPLGMACRSLLNRILQAAVDEQLIAANPVQRVRPPKRPKATASSSLR